MLELVSLNSVCYVPLLLKKLRETSVNRYRYTGRFMNVHLSKKSLGDNKPSDKFTEVPAANITSDRLIRLLPGQNRFVNLADYCLIVPLSVNLTYRKS